MRYFIAFFSRTFQRTSMSRPTTAGFPLGCVFIPSLRLRLPESSKLSRKQRTTPTFHTPATKTAAGETLSRRVRTIGAWNTYRYIYIYIRTVHRWAKTRAEDGDGHLIPGMATRQAATSHEKASRKDYVPPKGGGGYCLVMREYLQANARIHTSRAQIYYSKRATADMEISFAQVHLHPRCEGVTGRFQRSLTQHMA